MLMLFFFGALPIDTLKIKHTKKLKEIPSRHFLEKLPEKASMYAFIYVRNVRCHACDGRTHGQWKVEQYSV